MGQELRSWERLKPTEHCSSYQMAVRRPFIALSHRTPTCPNLDHVTDGRNIDRIKHWIGTTRSKLLGGTRAALWGAPKTHRDTVPPIKWL